MSDISTIFTNIARFGSFVPEDASANLYWPMVLIKVPSTVKTEVETRFSTQDQALQYIKKSIEKYLSLGTFYMIIDENNDPWDKPFPDVNIRELMENRIELP